MKNIIKLRELAAAALLGVFATHSNAALLSWEASSGLTPDQAGFTLYDQSTLNDPVFNGTELILDNNYSSETMYYLCGEPQSPLSFPTVTEISFNMKFISGSQRHSGRSSAGIYVTTAPYTGCNLYIDNDELFMAENFTEKGPSVAVDTTDSFHDYLMRIEGNDVSIFQDGNLVLTGNTKTLDQDYAATPRISFGDGTSLEYGASAWKSFSHNAAIPEPSSAILLSFSGLLIMKARKRFLS